MDSEPFSRCSALRPSLGTATLLVALGLAVATLMRNRTIARHERKMGLRP